MDELPRNCRNGKPPRECRRPGSLRGWGHGEVKREVLAGGTGAGGADGVRARAGAHVLVGGDRVDCREDWVHTGDAAHVSAPNGDRHRTARRDDER